MRFSIAIPCTFSLASLRNFVSFTGRSVHRLDHDTLAFCKRNSLRSPFPLPKYGCLFIEVTLDLAFFIKDADALIYEVCAS